MTWSDTPIDGQQNVAANKAPINSAFTYIANTEKVDHFWDNANSNLDGHHQFVQMPKNESGGIPANPTIATDIDGVFYAKEKTATEAPDIQITEPHYVVNDGANDQVLQLGFRAMVSFSSSGGMLYNHNVSSVTKNGTGLFTINFTTPLPSDKYIVFGSAMRSTASDAPLVMAIQNSTTITNKIKTTSIAVTFISTSSGAVRDPSRAMIAVCGG